MILGIGLENFQGFKGYQHVKFAPITVIFGPNASGKSSISRALRVLRQSGPTDDRSSVGAKVTLSGNDVDLNSLENARFGQSGKLATKILALEVAGELPSTEGRPWIFDSFTTRIDIIEGTEENPELTRFEVVTTYNFRTLTFEGKPVSLILHLDEWAMDGMVNCDPPGAWSEIEDYLNTVCRETPIEMNDESSIDQDDVDFDDLDQVSWHELFSDHWQLEVWDNLLQVSSFAPRKAQSWVELHKYRVIRDAFYGARTSYRGNFRGLRYIKPFRQVPVRVQVSNEGISSRENGLVANQWLGKLTDGRYKVVTARSTFASDISNFEVTENYVKDQFTGAAIGFDEVGTGISQVFPILQDLFEKPDPLLFGKSGSEVKLLIVEQPELHLHPRMQGDLADAVIDAVKNNPWPTQVILETHSENLLLRLQKRIREGSITKDDVSIIYVEPSDAENPVDRFNIMSNIEMDEAGDVIDPFPISFASLRVEDIL